VQWCRDGDLWRLFCVLYFKRATCSTFQTCILNSHWGHTMSGSMADIQSSTAEIRRGNKKEERKKNKQDENIMVCPILHRATIIRFRYVTDGRTWWKIPWQPTIHTSSSSKGCRKKLAANVDIICWWSSAISLRFISEVGLAEWRIWKKASHSLINALRTSVLLRRSRLNANLDTGDNARDEVNVKQSRKFVWRTVTILISKAVVPC